MRPRKAASLSTDNMPTHRPSEVIRGIKKQIANSFGSRGVGVGIYGKIVPLPTIGFREVGVGMQEIQAVIEQNPDMLDNLIKASLPSDQLIGFTTTRSMLVGEVADLINDNEVDVFTAKPPNNRGQDVQRRKLRILENEQRGIYLHPIMAAMYTADFDGDDMMVSLDPRNANNAKDPMDYMVGIDGEQSLDMSFLPVSEIVDGWEDGKTARDYVSEVMLSRWTSQDMTPDARDALSDLIDSVMRLSDTTLKGSDIQAAAYGDVFTKARMFADAYTGRRKLDSDRTMALVTQDVYQGMRNLRVNNALLTVGEVVPRDTMPPALTQSDTRLYNLIDGMVMGAIPNNFQELKVMMNGFLGNVEGKSAPFRFTADVGKMMKLDKRMRIGNEYVVDQSSDKDMKDFLEATVKFAYSKRMAVDVKQEGKSFYFTEILRNKVIREVGFPESYNTMSDFVTAFIDSYNRNAAIINEANLVWLSNMQISRNSNRKTVSTIRNTNNGNLSYSDVSSPFIEVYGTYSFDRIFGGRIEYRDIDERSERAGGPNKIEVDWRRSNFGRSWIKSRYKEMSIRAFSVGNHIIMEDKEKGKIVGASPYLATSDSAVVDGLVAAIADKRTSTTSKFNIDVIGKYDSKEINGRTIRTGISDKATGGRKTMIAMMAEELSEIRRLDIEESDNFDQMLHADDAVMALNATGYEMFRTLGMDSTAGFLTSKYGRKLVEHCDDINVIAGIRAAMVFAWQTSGVTRLADQLREIDMNPNATIARYMDLKNQAAFAVDELAAKSNVWQGIVAELRAMNPSQSAFAQLKTFEGRRSVEFWKAKDFWDSDHEYTSLKQVVEDLDMPWPLKCDIITDVVRWQIEDYQLNPFEVAFQLEVGGDSRFSLNGGAPKASLGVYNDAESAARRYANRSLENIRKEVGKAEAHYRNKGGVLTNAIHRLATSPWELVTFDDGMYADVILAVRDKVYAQTEKAQKHPATNAAYSALSFQRNGGFFNDVYRLDDRVLGLQHTSQLSAGDLVRLLDDPNYMLTVYDDYGSVGFLSQRTLTGLDHNASEQELWDFLVENPRLACMLRSSAACVSSDSDGNGYIGTRLSLEETIGSYGDGGHDVMGHMKYLMRDHPVYAGLISMLNPAHGTSTRNERSRVPKVEEAVCRELYRAAVQDGEMGATRVLTNLGITRLKLRSLLTSDFDKYMASMEQGWSKESIGEARAEADDIYDTLERHVANYIAEIRQEIPYDESFVERIDSSSVPMGIDVESVASFWDAVQELSGAKVGVSTGIEGSETYQLSYWVSHASVSDNYANLEAIADMIVDSDDPTMFDGMWTNKGTLQVSVDESGDVITNINELRQTKKNEGDEIVTRVPEGFTVPDRSTDSYGMQVPSLYACMVSKRSNGAEKFNLKAMKAGLDGTDSVTKMRGGKYLTEQYGDGTTSNVLYFQVRQDLDAIAAEQGIDMARIELANRLMAQDREMGYADMTLANYMCLAELMLVEDPEGGVVLRSLEQLMAAARGRIGSRVDEMTDAEVSKEIDDIIADTSEQGVGLSMVWDARELLSEMRPKAVAGDAMASVRISSSVFHRNYDLLSEIERSTGIRPLDGGEREDAHNRIVGTKDKAGVKGVLDVWNRSSIIRNHQAIGYVGAADGSQDLSLRNIGPSTAIVIGDGPVSASMVAMVCEQAYESGTTIVVSFNNISSIPPRFVPDMIPISDDGDMMIPMFDARLNGSEAKPFEPRFAIFKVPFNRYVTSVEDRFNVFELGDAQYKFTKALTSRMHAHDDGSVTRSAMELFPNVFANKEYRDSTFSISLANGQLVRDLICNTDEPRCTIDYGLVEGAKGFGQRVHDVNAAIRRYREQMNFSDDQDSVLRGVDGIAPGDIVAWADLTITREGFADQHVLAPIIPFQLHEGKKVPESFRVIDVGPTNGDGSLLTTNWSYDKDFFSGDFVKYFDSSGGANKGMINLTDTIDETMRLKNGMDVDAYCAAASTDSRKIGTDRRIKTMISLMAIARMQGYNFARMDGAFPDDPKMKETLSNGRIPREVWASYYDGFNESGIRFSNDPQMNAFLDYECRKIYDNGGNPSDYLATSFDGDNNEHVMWEFECMFDNSMNYEDSLLRFLHFVNPELCPDGIDDATEDTYFRLYRDGKDDLGAGFDRGMLQMQVPFPMSDGRISYIWSNVFVGMSFFGEEYSANSRPNVNGSSDMLDAENTMSHYGKPLSKDKSRKRAAWATAGYGRVPMDAGALGLV